MTESRHESEPALQIPTQEGLSSWRTGLGAEGPGIARGQSRRGLRGRMRTVPRAGSPSHGPEPVVEELRHGHARPCHSARRTTGRSTPGGGPRAWNGTLTRQESHLAAASD